MLGCGRRVVGRVPVGPCVQMGLDRMVTSTRPERILT